MVTLIDRIEDYESTAPRVIKWSSPVPFFGDLEAAHIATVGINPSNREFVSEGGDELMGEYRRFPTLRSLECLTWSDVTSLHVREMLEACQDYFQRTPYDRWFRVLERILEDAGVSLYRGGACHIDLVPYATSEKWGMLSGMERRTLLATSGEAIGRLIRDSDLQLLILNGRSVVTEFERMAVTQLMSKRRPDWDLPRASGPGISGYAYEGEISRIGGIELDAPLKVLGYNHNLQSSFGVTSLVIKRIARWIGDHCGTD